MKTFFKMFAIASLLFLLGIGLLVVGAIGYGYFNAKNAVVPEDTIAGLMACMAIDRCNRPVIQMAHDGEMVTSVVSQKGNIEMYYYVSNKQRFGVVLVNVGESSLLLEDSNLTGVISKIREQKSGSPLEEFESEDIGFKARFADSQALYVMAMETAEREIIPDEIKKSLKGDGAVNPPKPKKGIKEA